MIELESRLAQNCSEGKKEDITVSALFPILSQVRPGDSKVGQQLTLSSQLSRLDRPIPTAELRCCQGLGATEDLRMIPQAELRRSKEPSRVTPDYSYIDEGWGVSLKTAQIDRGRVYSLLFILSHFLRKSVFWLVV